MGVVVDGDGLNGSLLVVGELCVDIVVTLGESGIRFGQHEQLVPSTAMTMGSSSAITACQAAALGIRTVMVGVRGDDDFGAFVARGLAARGVHDAGVRIDPDAATGSSVHLTRPDGDRAILTAMGAIGTTRASDVLPELLADAAHLHVGSYFLQDALWADAADLFARARAAGLSTSVDGNFDPALTWDRGIGGVLQHADVFFCNDQELTGVAGVDDPDAALAAVIGRMPDGAVVVHKLGADGAAVRWLRDGAVSGIRATPPSVPGALVDTVGAGDSLAAGFLAARLRGGSVADALALGVACGTASTRGAGGVGAQPDLAAAQSLAETVAVVAG